MGESRRDLLEERVFEYLTTQLSGRQIAVGAHLKAGEIAAELDVSRTTVRKAISRLVDAGWVRLNSAGRPEVAKLPRKRSTPAAKFDPSNQTEIVYWSVFDRILQGECQPGAGVDTQRLARYYRVSLGTVRQALDWLTRDGLLERLPRRGWKFVSLEWHEVVDTVQMRLLLETESLHRVQARITREMLKQLAAANARTLKTINKLSECDRRRADYAFHRTLAECSGSRILVDMLDPLIRRSMFVGVIYPVERRHASRTFEEHLKIIHALERGDEKTAIDCLRTHISRWLQETLDQHDPDTLEKLFAVLPKSPPTGSVLPALR